MGTNDGKGYLAADRQKLGNRVLENWKLDEFVVSQDSVLSTEI